MSYPTSRYPWVPVPNLTQTKPSQSSDLKQPHPPIDLPPGLGLTGSKSPSRGRGLVATTTFPAGSAIAAFPRPLLCLPDRDHVRTCCDWCLRAGSTASPPASETGPGPETNAKLSVCARCRYVVYCSKKCQAAAWKAVHKLECPALCRIKDEVFGVKGKETDFQEEKWFVPTPVRAVMQLLLRLGQGDERVRDAVGGVPYVGAGGRERGVLEGNVDGFRADDKVWGDLGAQAQAAVKFSGLGIDPERIGGVLEVVREVLCKLQTNAFDRRDEDVCVAGVFLDAGLAMANHSCVPNAYVVFVGRTAMLRAEREIKEGEEVEISYIDNTLSKAERHEALRLYHFQCQCRRCQEDLDVYQVCQSSPTIKLNIFSLQPNLKLYANPPIQRTAFEKATLKGNTQNQLWAKCEPLLKSKMYAIEPLPSTIHSLIIRHETSSQNFAYALCLACFLATHCHPYAHPSPFSPWRVKGAMMIAQLLSQTAPLSAMGELGTTCPDARLVDTLARIDQVSLCEAVLRIVVYHGPMAHSDDWEVVVSARELLDDIAQLQGRERESAGIGRWASAPEREEARGWFERAVMGPVRELAGFAEDIVERELKGDDRLAVREQPGALRRLVYQP